MSYRHGVAGMGRKMRIAVAGAGLLLVAGVLAATAVARADEAAPAGEMTVRLECTADTGVFHFKGLDRSSMYDVNYGAAKVVPFHGIHYLPEFHDSSFLYLADFDVAKARGLKASGATLHLRLVDAPDADNLRLVSVSTVSTAWNEGKGTGEKAETKGGGATSNWAVFGERRWADPQSELNDVILGGDNSLYQTEPVRHEKDGWVAVDVPADIVQAMISGGSSGLALFEEKGQTNIDYHVYTRESESKPYLVVRGMDGPTEPPPAVSNLKVEPASDAATLRSGAVRLRMAVADGTNRLAVAWRIGDGLSQELARWRTPWPKTGAMSMVIDDLPAGEPIEVIVTAIGPDGKASAVCRAKGTVSPAKPLPAALAFGRKANATGEPKTYDGKVRIWAYDQCQAANPVSGNLLEEVGIQDYSGKPAGEYRRGNDVWDGKDGVIVLAGGRNEVVAFNLAIEAVKPPLEGVEVKTADIKGPDGFEIPATNVRGYRLWYLKDTVWKGEVCLPLQAGKSFSIPAADNEVPGQRNQSVLVDVWIPKDAPAGSYQGTVTVSAAGVGPVAVPVQLRVWPVTLPDKLSFNCELNAYSSAALTKDYAWYRIAHAHRTTLNVLPYSQNGSLKSIFEMPLAGDGAKMHVADWSKYDSYFAPLLDGSAFKNMPGAGVPLASQYLPFNEAWPVNFRDHYAFKSTSLEEHYLKAGPIESLMDKEYAPTVEAVIRDWIEHFQKMGWTRTQMEFFLNAKQGFTKGKLGFWALDEPQHRDDYLALRYWARLFKAAAVDQRDTKFLFRLDISRPYMQREWFDKVVDMEVVGAGAFFGKSRCREDLLRRGFEFYPYGALNPVRNSNLNAEAWPVAVYLLGGDGLVPWDTIGSKANYREPLDTAVLLPAPAGSPADEPVVCSVRLKALRRGQQDVEYLALLARKMGYDREQINGLLAGLLDLHGTTAERFTDEAGETIFNNLTAEQFAQLRAAVAARLASAPSGK